MWYRVIRSTVLTSSASLLILSWTDPARPQEATLPEIVVQAQRTAPPRRTRAPAPSQGTATAAPQLDANAVLAEQNTQFDIARDNLSPRFGASTFDMNRAFIESLPQGSDGSINKVLLQAPGVTQDSAASGEIHVRNEHGNLQYRINGITLPDGISGFGHVLDSKFIGNLALITGALPAQFGLRTVRRRRHPDQERQRARTGRQRRRLRRQLRHRHAELRIRRPDREARNISSTAAASPAISASKTRPTAGTRSTTGPSRAISSATPRPCSIRTRALPRSSATPRTGSRFRTTPARFAGHHRVRRQRFRFSRG